jgi:titin
MKKICTLINLQIGITSILFLSILLNPVHILATEPPPEAPTSLETIVMYNQVNLLWQDNSTSEKGFVVERKTGIQDFDTIAELESNCSFYLDMHLKSQTTYYYRVKSFNNAGFSTPSNEAKAITEKAPSEETPPEAPSRLLGRATSPTQIQLAWQDNSTNETGFEIARRTSGSPYEIKGQVFSDVTTFTDNMVEPDRAYFYKIRAVNSYGESPYCEEIQVRTKSAKDDDGDTSPPSRPKNVEVLLENKTILLTWEDTSSNEDGFRIYMSIDDPEMFALYKDLPVDTTRFEEKELIIPGHTFYFHITAFNKYGESEPSNNVMITIKETDTKTIPEKPTDLKAFEIYATEVVLKWSDNANNEQGYKIERRRIDEGKFTLIQTVPENVSSFKDEKLTSDSIYNYRVYAYNSAGSSFPSNTLEVRTKKDATTPPPVDPPSDDTIVIKLQIGSKVIQVNNKKETMDVAPITMFERTVLPIRYVVEALGGELGYEVHSKTITIELDAIRIEMQLKNPVATVNGTKKQIDPDDPRVMPISVPPGRTMIPVRFVAENLGCQVEWEPHTKSITITKE